MFLGMVRDDNAGALELHIRVNGQNLSAIPEKCNTGTLRLPSDPSWPKIPLRRLTGNTDDVIKPPCVVTVTGTPRRNRNTMQTITCQYSKSGMNNKYETCTHMPERLPGCVDPRFKRQVSRQKHTEETDELCNANQTQMREDLPHECQSDGVKCEEVASDTRTFVSANSKTCTSKGSGNGKAVQQHNTRNISENKNASHRDDGCVSNWTRNKENINNNNLNIRKILLDQDRHGNLNMRDNAGNTRSYENASNLNITGKLGNAQGDSRSNHTLQHHSRTTLSTFERKVSSERIGTAGILPENCLRCSCVKTNISSDKMLREDTLKVTGEECWKSDGNKARSRHREVCCNNSRRKTSTNPINLSRKAKSYFRKRSRLATTDSDCTLMLPGPRCIKRQRYRCESTRDCLRANQLSRRRNWMDNGMNPIRMKSYASRRNRMKRSRLFANLRADNHPFEQPSPIPLETQELLNKSYWEYYRKLRRKVALADPNTARHDDKRPNEPRSRANLPASRTLQQCSVLSCMINNTLDASGKAFRDPASAVEKSFSDPVANGSATHENVCEAFDLSSMRVKKIKRKKTSYASKRLLGFKAIVFLVVMVYVTIIFFPMMYDYLMLDEEHDDYGDVSYVALALEYIASSFEEAFDEIADVANIVFQRPTSSDRNL